MFKYHIQTIEIGSGGAGAITFNNIPQTYDDLLLVTSLRDTSSTNGWTNALIKPNNVSTNLTTRVLYGWGTGNVGGFGDTYIYHETVGGGSTAGTFSNSSIYISDYRASTSKSFSVDTSTANNGNAINAIVTGLWNSTAAITSLALEGQSGNFAQYSSASLYGIKRGTNGSVRIAANGGTVAPSGAYTVHTFTASSTFVANRNMTVETLVVGGGGGGGSDQGGGGGAGGYVASSVYVTAGTSYPVIVGAGGAGMSANSGTTGSSGTNSIFSNITAIGGGRGGSGGADNAQVGGSGGGGGAQVVAGVGAAGTNGQGFAGGNSSGTFAIGGGGGGAAEAGNTDGQRQGGDGIVSNISGSFVTRAGGGGGGSANDINGGAGLGGGGNGTGGNTTGGAGTANTGGGGGGGGSTPGVGNGAGGAGGSGVVIIRYLTQA